MVVGEQFAFQQTDIDLAVHRKIYPQWKKIHQFVSYDHWRPKPKKQEEILATLRFQLAVK